MNTAPKHMYVQLCICGKYSEQIRKALAQTELVGWYFWQRDAKLYVSNILKSDLQNTQVVIQKLITSPFEPRVKDCLHTRDLFDGTEVLQTF